MGRGNHFIFMAQLNLLLFIKMNLIYWDLLLIDGYRDVFLVTLDHSLLAFHVRAIMVLKEN